MIQISIKLCHHLSSLDEFNSLWPLHHHSFLLIMPRPRRPRPGRKAPVRRKPQSKKSVTPRLELYSRILSWIASIPPSHSLSDLELLHEQETLTVLGLPRGIPGNAPTPMEEPGGPAGKRRRTADTTNKDLRRSNRMQKMPDKYAPASMTSSGKYIVFHESFSHLTVCIWEQREKAI